MENQRYNIELEVLTPLCVGAGGEKDWQPGADFVQNDGKIYVLNIQKVAEQGVDMDKLSNLFLKSDNQGIISLIGTNHLADVSDQVFTTPVSTTNPIKTFLRTQYYDLPVIAGSSIKGAIRSALFNYFSHKEREEDLSKFRKNDKRVIKGQERKGFLNEYVFGKMDEGSDFMRFIQVGDFVMPKTTLANSTIFNLQRSNQGEMKGGWKHKGFTSSTFLREEFNTLYECVPPGEKNIGHIVFAKKPFELRFGSQKTNYSEKDELMEKGIKALFHIINQVTKEYLEKELSFFNQYSAERSDEIIKSIQHLLGLIPLDDSYCLMKMAAGTGYHSITGDWQYSDYDKTGIWTKEENKKNAGKKKVKSRKTIEYNGNLQLMGFVKLQAVSDNEAIQRQKTPQSIVDELNNKSKELRERAVEEKRRQEEERQKRLQYQNLIDEAKRLQDDARWQEAIEKANAASEIMPENDTSKLIIDKCNKELAKICQNQQFMAQEAAAEKAKFSQPLSEVLIGKTSVGNIIGTTAKWAKQEGNIFSEAEYSMLSDALIRLPEKEQRKIIGRKAELIKAIGNDWTEKVLSKFNQ